MEVFRVQHIEPNVLNAERIRILALIAECIAPELVHEVGSTAIPGVIGKQDLDFLVLVPPSEFQAARTRLDMSFIRNPEQLSNEVYQGYSVASKLDVSIQLTIEGGAHDTFLVFLRHLGESAELRDEYNLLKQAFDGRAMDEYREAKHDFIERVLSGMAAASARK